MSRSIHEPPRGGTRGGKDQFTWKSVEVDKYRENYLANSLMAPVGRWQKGKDLTWYTKDSKIIGKKERLKREMAAIKEAEQAAMSRALGLKTPTPVGFKPPERLSQEEIGELCKRREDDEDVLPEERMKGVGFKNLRASMLGASVSTSKDGVTKFELDQKQFSQSDKLVLKSNSAITHQKTSTVLDHTPSITNINDEKEIWIPVNEKKKIQKDKKKKQKKHKHSKTKHNKMRKCEDYKDYSSSDTNSEVYSDRAKRKRKSSYKEDEYSRSHHTDIADYSKTKMKVRRR